MGKTISYKRPDGKSVNGYLAEPSGGKGYTLSLHDALPI